MRIHLPSLRPESTSSVASVAFSQSHRGTEYLHPDPCHILSSGKQCFTGPLPISNDLLSLPRSGSHSQLCAHPKLHHSVWFRNCYPEVQHCLIPYPERERLPCLKQTYLHKTYLLTDNASSIAESWAIQAECPDDRMAKTSYV